ncbi:MAG: hypothetical protein SGILL_003383, partial [Bacillariaceae sp.]
EVMIDAYLEALMEDHKLVKLPYNMGTSNATVQHLFGVDRSIVEEAIATLESTIDGWNREVGTIVGHPIVYVIADMDEEEEGSAQSPLTHHPEFFVPWSLLELTADVLWEEHQTRLGVFPEAIEKMFIVNVLNVVSAILFDLLLSLSVSMNNGSIRLCWQVDKDKYRKYFEDLAKDPVKFREIVKQSLIHIDFDEVSRQAKESVRQQQQQQTQEVKQGQEDVLQYLYQLAQDTSLSHTSLDHVKEQLYEMTFKLMLILFYWFTLDTEAYVLGRSVTQHFVKPKRSIPVALKTNVRNEETSGDELKKGYR